MIILAMAKRLWGAMEQRATQDLNERQLRHLDDHLLRDIGLRRDGSRIVEMNPAVSGADVSVAHAPQETKPAEASGRIMPIHAPPQVDGG